MQLFITDLVVRDDTIITIENKEILDQIRKVLRGKIGNTYFFQNLEGKRWRAQIESRDNKTLQAKILEQVPRKNDNKISTQLLVAYPNKRSKAELIVQKLTEIGIDKIIFWPAERSIIRKKNENKEKRILSIAREAAEQSWRRFLPEIIFAENNQNTFESVGSELLLIFDFSKNKEENVTIDSISFSTTSVVSGVIGPEGGLTPKDYNQFGNFDAIITLTSTVLRMETAAILAAREIIKKGENK